MVKANTRRAPKATHIQLWQRPAFSLGRPNTHYFMPYRNLFDHCDRANQTLAAEQLSGFNQGEMIKWFVDK